MEISLEIIEFLHPSLIFISRLILFIWVQNLPHVCGRIQEFLRRLKLIAKRRTRLVAVFIMMARVVFKLGGFHVQYVFSLEIECMFFLVLLNCCRRCFEPFSSCAFTGNPFRCNEQSSNSLEFFGVNSIRSQES